MADPTQTQRSFPPSIGLALMAARLAIHRSGYSWDPTQWNDFGMVSREKAATGTVATKTSREFYAILDRIHRGEKP